jgi:predicted nucleotidyltransferase
MRKVRTKLFETVTSKVKETALRFDPNAEVILFGSRARGDYRKDSDWDFLILTDLSVDWRLTDKIRDEIFDTELETETAIFSLVKNRKEWKKTDFLEINQNIFQEGIKI